MTKLTGVSICVPAYGFGICMETAQSLFRLGQYLLTHKIPHNLSSFGACDIEEVRNIFVTMWYDGMPNSSHLLFIDTDMEFDPTLVNNMLAFDKPLVGVYYAKRQYPMEAVGQSFRQDELSDVHNGFLKVLGIGAGVMLIRRDLVTTMIEKMPQIIDEDEACINGHPNGDAIKAYGGKRIIRPFDRMRTESGFKLSEDMSFCKRWRDCGGEIWAEVNHVVGHIGRHNYTLRYMDHLENKAKEEKNSEAA